jgi:undecaprenyl diphosphate synthase
MNQLRTRRDPLTRLATGRSGRAYRAAVGLVLRPVYAVYEALADSLSAEAVAAHLYTRGSSDPDLIIRTSGEIRLSGFLPWQSVYSEYHFCEAHWPAFRRIDFLRAIRTYQHRSRRFGR